MNNNLNGTEADKSKQNPSAYLAARKTKIVATVGPSCDSYDGLLQLAQAGVNVFRLNFSHGAHEKMSVIIGHIRRINEKYQYNISILGDLQGPKLRIGDIENGVLEIAKGDLLTFTSKEKVMGSKEKMYISYRDLQRDVKAGDSILIDDGKLEVKVVDVDKESGNVSTVVTYGGLLYPRVNLPDTNISLPAMTDKDLADLEFILENELDWVALSFVRSADDIKGLRERIALKGSNIKVMAKIEMPAAMKCLNEIINISDGILIARGDLGVELPAEKVPNAQSTIIRKCIHHGKPVIVATQMMESMITGVRPNRSDVRDVANAVREGTDAVMLSAETAMGNHPALVVDIMCRIINEVESTDYFYNREQNLTPQKTSPTFLSDAICYNACKLAHDISAAAMIGMTQSGYTAFMLSSYRPRAPLYVFSKKKWLVNQLSISWGVQAFFYDKQESLDKIISEQITILKSNGYLNPGDVVVNTGSTPIELELPTNIIKITTVD